MDLSLRIIRQDTADAVGRLFGRVPTTRQLLRRLPSVRVSVKETLVEDDRSISTVKKIKAIVASDVIPSVEEFERMIAWTVRNIKNPGSYGNQVAKIVAWISGLMYVKQNQPRGDFTDGKHWYEVKLATIGKNTPIARILNMWLYRNITHYIIIVLDKLSGEIKYLVLPARKFEGFLLKSGRANDTNDGNTRLNYKGENIKFTLDKDVFEWCEKNNYIFSAADFITALRENAK